LRRETHAFIDLSVRVYLFLLAMLLLPAPLLAARLTGLSVVPGVVTVVADGPPAVAHQFALTAPDRLVIDLPAVVPAQLSAPGAGSIVAVRAAMFSPVMARLVLDLSGPLEIVAARSSATGLTLTLRRISATAFAEQVRRGRTPLPVAPMVAATPAAPADFNLPPDMFASREPTAPPAAADQPAIPPAPPAGIQTENAPAGPAGTSSPPSRRMTAIRSRSGGKPLVVIDAGHGGKDVGAISVLGGYEKDVTLAIARLTARRLERGGRVRVQLTRDNDRFIPLGGRVMIARKAQADLFISIHADSAPNPEARGASVYTVSAVASDAIAARLAARENKADIIGGVNLGVEAPEVGDIMIDLSRRATSNVSVLFADILQDALSDRIRFRGEFHRFAGFIVLKAPDVPSVLLETGYVTNRDDAAVLFSGEGRQKFADGIARAVERHLLGD
jgi:N-acetylmuramoyl-L-alanine amidase